MLEQAFWATVMLAALAAILGGVVGFFAVLGWVANHRSRAVHVAAAFVIIGLIWVEMFFLAGQHMREGR